MEVGELLKQMIYLVIPVVAVIVFISIAWNSSGQDCKLAVSGNDFIILANLKACIERCWSKHDSGTDLYVDDCFVVNVATKEQLDKNRIESSVSKAVPVRVYFDLLEENESYVIKVRYNSTGKEISLILFETSSQSTTTTEIQPSQTDTIVFYSTLKEKEYDNVEILLVQRLKDFGLSYVKSHPIKDFDQTNLDRTNTLILLHPVEKELAQAQIQKIKTWVQKGGNLMGIGLNLTDIIMMDIFGVSGQPQSSFINPVENQSSYLKIKQRTKIFNGISGIDYNPSYGLVLNYTSISGKILAEIYDSSKSKVIGTGIIENDYGSGEAYYFGYTIGYTILRMIEGKGLEPPTLRGTEYQAVLSESEWDYPVADFHIYPIINIILEKKSVICLLDTKRENFFDCDNRR
jgi:hypothetical protein